MRTVKNILIPILITVCILVSIPIGSSAKGINFPDVKNNDWFKEDVYKLVELGVINGMPDGTFKPYNNLRVSECIKLLTCTLDIDMIDHGTGYWAQPYIDVALDLGIVEGGEYPTYKINFYEAPATRGEVARMIVRTIGITGEDIPTDYEKYAPKIKDIKSTDEKYRDYILVAYSKGIIQGYPDGRFGWNDNVTRAEVSAMLVRMLYLDRRLKVQEPTGFVDPNKPYKYYDDDPVYNGLAEMYPENFARSSDGSIIGYYSKGKPSHEGLVGSIFIRKWSGIDYMIVTQDKYFTDSDKPALKNILKMIYPTQYEKVYNMAIEMMGKPEDTPDIKATYDNMLAQVRRNTDGILIIADSVEK